MNSSTIHGVTEITASRHDYENSPLRLTLKTEFSDHTSEVILFFRDGNDALVKQLIDAINTASEPAAQVQEVAA